MKYKYIYFDLDGTIIDSSEGVVNSALYALKKFNMDKYSIDTIKQTLIGPPLFEGLKKLIGCTDENILNDMVRVFRNDYSSYGVFQNNLFKDIKNMLDILYNLGSRMEILTSKPEKFAKQIIKQHNLEKYFININGAGELDKKSSKSCKLGISTVKNKELSIMIGDRTEDIIAGQDNGVDTIAVTYGFDNIKLLKNQKPTYIIDNVMDIIDIIKGK